jgi:hypothetical protein
MAKQPRTYERLTRPATSVGSYKTLWLASDHLLIVNSTGYSEEYQRLQFSDIKGFFIAPSDRRLIIAAPWIILALVCGVTAASTLSSGQTPYVSGVLLAVAVALLLWNQLLGPTCRVYFVTRVQMAQLPSLVRRRKAGRVLGRLKPLIDAYQAAPHPAAEPPAIPQEGQPGPPAL